MRNISAHLSQLKTTLQKQFQTAAQGFTLIELLVVIGILGILAASLVATIDPFEQLKKAADANVKNTTVEFITASQRYYTTHNNMMWGDTNVSNCSGGTAPTTAGLDSAGFTGCLSALISDGELKPGFTTATNLISNVIVSGGSNSVTACFLPQSKAEQRGANTKYNANGATNANCPATNPGGTSCYWCSL